MISVAAIVGPTGVGKTEVALEVAERLGAEIVSVDSMQIYKGMDIGTAKPSFEERRSVRHHLIDRLEPSHELTVAEYQSLGRRAIEEIAGRRALPLLVGGSGLYFRAIVDDLQFPPRALEIRAALETEAAEKGPEALHARLSRLDGRAAAAIEPSNVRRTIRALEVIAATGRRFSDNATEWGRYASRYRLAVAGLTRSRAELFDRIRARVDRMIEAGLVNEARALNARGMSRAARQALGYRQAIDAAAIEPGANLSDEITRATKRFARRQESWFKTDPRVVWFEASDPHVVERIHHYFTYNLGDARDEEVTAPRPGAR
jgi:tRNA dimethylallyltransferase